MKARSGFAQGMAWNLASAALPLVASFLVSVLLFPYLGREATGQYILVMSAATVLLIVAKFGVQSAASRLITENQEDPGVWIRAGIAVRSMFTLPTALLAVVVSPFLARAIDGPSLIPPFWMVAPVLLAASAYELASESLVGLRRFSTIFLVRLCFLVLRVAAVLIVRSAALGVVAFLVGHVISQLATSAAAWGWILRHFPSRATSEERTRARRRVLVVSAPLALSSASFLIYAQTDKLMVGWLRDAATAGDFGVARTVLDAALFPTFAIAWTLRPALVSAVKSENFQETRARLMEGLRWSIAYALGGGLMLYWLGPAVLVRLFTHDFSASGPLLRIMVPILVLRGIGTVIFPSLLATDRQTTYARLMVLTALLNVVANLLLIPPLGAEGAILATIASLIPLTVGGLWIVRKLLLTPEPSH